MNVKSIVAHIKGMRERDGLDEIIKAAEARDSHLAQLEAEGRWRRAWSKFSHLKPGSIVFLHAKPTGRNEAMFGVGLKVKKVLPRKKEIVVETIQPVRYHDLVPMKGASNRGKYLKPERFGYFSETLTAMMCDSYKLSDEPTVAAFGNAVHGEVMERKVR
jgi:hypothetical protein